MENDAFVLEIRGYVCFEDPTLGKTHFTATYTTQEEALAKMKLATQDDDNVYVQVFALDPYERTIREWYYGGPDFDDL